MSDQPSCLFVTASGSACAGEVTLVKDCLANLGVTLREVEWLSLGDFLKQMSAETKYDFIYLGAHADGTGFGEKDGALLHPWEDLANAICSSNCMRPNGTLFLGCCRGGMKTVALKILTACQKIDYITGPHWKVTGNDLTAAFQAFAQSRIKKKEEPCRAAERATEACGFKFTCHDRQELQAEIETLKQIRTIEWRLDSIFLWQEFISQQLAGLTSSLQKLVPPEEPPPPSDPQQPSQPK